MSSKHSTEEGRNDKQERQSHWHIATDGAAASFDNPYPGGGPPGPGDAPCQTLCWELPGPAPPGPRGSLPRGSAWVIARSREVRCAQRLPLHPLSHLLHTLPHPTPPPPRLPPHSPP